MSPIKYIKYKGYVLITSVTFLAILAMIGVTMMRITRLNQMISSNLVFKGRAFETSEAARGAISEVLDNHIFYRGWPSNIQPPGNLPANIFLIPEGLVIPDNNSDGFADELYEKYDIEKDKEYAARINQEEDSLDKIKYEDLTPVASYQNGGAGANLYLIRTNTAPRAGSATPMSAGYEGLAKSSASGGALIYFDLRSVSNTGAGGAQALTGSDYRYVVR